MGFEQLTRAEQRYEVESVLPTILASIDRPTPTVIIVARVARALKSDPAFVTGLVISLAREGHPNARKDGETFKRYGKTMKRWTWRPSPGVEAATSVPVETLAPALPIGHIEAMLTESGVIDTSEW